MAIEPVQLHPEITAWLARRAATLQIVKTTVTPHGQTIDWVPIASQHPSGKIATQPPMSLIPPRAVDPGRPSRAIVLELDDPGVERGPPGTVPIPRPSVAKLKATTTLRDYAVKRGGMVVNKVRAGAAPTDPNPAGYFHQTDSQNGTFYGWDGHLSVWAPAINNPPGPGDDHSILQFWLQNYDKGFTQSIEGGWTVDENLNGDTQPHIFTYFTTNGYSQDGDNIGGYNRLNSGWVQVSPTIFPGIRISTASTVGGPQYDVSMKFQLYKEPTDGSFNWWVAVQGTWIGYYPATLFNGGLGGKAEWFGIGGEVYSSLSNPEATHDQMGSGFQANGGWTKAAFARNIRTQIDMNGTMAINNGSGVGDAATPGGADPYTIETHMNSGGSWGSYFFVGGPTSIAPPAALFNHVTFTIVTDGDDLRGDSSAVATIALPSGTQSFTLKGQNEGPWGNNTTHTKSFAISGPAQPLSAFGAVKISLTSHNGIFETDDNWNIQSVEVALSGPGGSASLRNRSGNPFARLTGSGPTVTL